MNLYYFFALTFGLLLGFFYFKSLHVGLKRMLHRKSPLFFLLGFFIRVVFIAGAVFAMVKFESIGLIGLFLLGFFLSMFLMIVQNLKKKRAP